MNQILIKMEKIKVISFPKNFTVNLPANIQRFADAFFLLPQPLQNISC